MSQKYLPSTSRDLDPTNYAWDSIVYQAGRPMLDSELNLTQDILNKKNTLPSGMISYQGQDESIGSFVFEKPYDEADPPNLNANFVANGFVINPFKAMVNGMVIDVRNTEATDGTNKITLPTPQTTQGNGAGIRGDFVFLEVWRREVTPAMQSKSRIKVLSPQANDTFTFQINGQTNPPPHADTKVLTAVGGVLGATQFQIGATPSETARNLAQAINDYDGLGLGLTVGGVKTLAETRGTEYVFLNHNGGVSGNHDGSADSFNLASSTNASILVLNQPSGGSDGEGKPNANKVYYAGNVDSPSGVWLDDNIQDANVNVSSTRRIQVQYRLRSFSNENLSDQIFGFENTDIVAQGSKGSPVATYTFSRHSTDTGLWYAGNGSQAHATALGTVDGYVYAIPICYAFRRWSNDGANGFNAIGKFNTGALHNHDGATLGANNYVDNVAIKESDRPDGLFADQIAEYDTLDLRRRVYPRGVDFSAELDYQYHSLLDETNKTWYASAHNLQATGNGSGGISHTPLVCDVYGRDEQGNIGGAGQWRQNFDHIARRWSNEPTTERIYIVAKPSNTVAQPSTGISVAHDGGAGDYWYEGDQITIDLTALDISGHLGWATNNGDLLPADDNTIIPKLIDIGYCWHNDGHFTNAVEQQVRIQSITGLGSNQVILTLNANPSLSVNGGVSGAGDYDLVGDATNGESTGSNKEIFIELIFDYPSIDRGLSGTVAEAPMPDSSGYPTGSAVLTQSAPTNSYDPYPGKGNGNAPPISNVIPNTKEVSLEYVYAQQTIQLVSGSPTSSYLPWRLYYNPTLAPTITDQSGVGTILTLDNANTNYQHAESKIGWTNGVGWNAGQRLIEITAYPLEPYPDAPTDSTILVYYRRYAPKTVGSDFAITVPDVGTDAGGVIPDELNLQPLVIGKDIGAYLKTSEHYPFFNPTDQLATHFNASNYEEYETLGSPEVILDDLKINTGSINLPSFVPFVSSVNVTLGDTNVNQVPRKDNESRAYYPTMEDSSYFPSAFAKNMGGTHSNYKTSIHCLMKVVDDTHTLYRKGEVVLVVFVKTNEWGQGVAVDMREETLSDNYVAACVYRTRNQLLLGE
jgi:hypothetical protein